MVVQEIELKERKIFFFVSILFFVYLIILSIEFIKRGASVLLQNSGVISHISTSPTKAFGFGWILSGVTQSGGASTSLSLVLLGTGAIGLVAAVYIIMGCFVGRTLTANIVSFFTKSKNKKDFRHGFEIAAANNIYNIFLAIIAIVLESGFGFFSKIGILLGDNLKDKTFINTIPGFSEKLTSGVIEKTSALPSQWITIIIGFSLLILSLELLTRSVLNFMGGRDNARNFVKKYMGVWWKAFFVGLVITFLVTSTNVTITLLVPLAVARIIKLKEAIPYIIGANIGTVTEVLIAALVIGTPLAIAASMVYILIPIVGALIFLPGSGLIHKLTKELSKHFIKISRPRALLYLILFFVVPVLLLFV